MKKFIVVSLLLFFTFTVIAATCVSADESTNSTIVDFSATPVSGVAPLTVSFTDLSTGNPVIQSWNWDFGDGTANSNDKNPVHKYNSAGRYSVKLTVKDSEGSSTKTKSNYISVITSSPSPVASFSASPTSGYAPLSVTFTDTSTGSPASWRWSFGDGSTSNLKNPSHTYNSAGSYTVTLTVNNTAGSSVSSLRINVSSSSTIVVGFNSSVSSGEAPLIVQFFDLSTGNPTSWFWDFGDGTNSTTKNPSHTYQKAGTYSVSLKANSSTASGMASKTNYITVGNNILTAAFNAYPTQGNAPLTVQFTDASVGSPTSWLWDFGDGNSSTLQNPSNRYIHNGSYAVTLTVSNNIGSNTKTATSLINVSPINTLIANFNVNVSSGKTPLTVKFYDLSTGSPTKWLWNFGDGNNSTDQNPTHTYTGLGKYSVTLQASNDKGNNALTLPEYITVNKESDSSSSSSGSGSMDSGSLSSSIGSPEPTSNVEVTLQVQRYVAAGNHIKFEFTKGATCIDYVELDAKKTQGKTTATIEQLLDLSVLTPNAPMGKVYKYVNIWVGNNGFARPENIENVSIGFSINKANASIKETEVSTVVLQRYEDGDWVPHKTVETKEDEKYISFQANTTGFASFAITSSEITPEENNVTENMTHNMSQPQFNNTFTIKDNKQLGKAKTDNTDWKKYSDEIKIIIVLIVAVFLGFALKEKMK